MPLMPFVIIILSFVIVLSACRFQVYQPKTYNEDALISPYGLSMTSDQGSPNLNQAFMIIDQQTFNLIDLYLTADVAASNDIIFVDGSTGSQNIINYPQDLTNLSFKAMTDVYCVKGQCQGVKMSGFADVDINLDTLSVHVKNLNASTPDHHMVLSGSIERVLPHELLQSLAKADLVLTINDANMVMDPEAQMLFYQSLAREGVLDGIFRIKNKDFGIILDGNMNSR